MFVNLVVERKLYRMVEKAVFVKNKIITCDWKLVESYIFGSLLTITENYRFVVNLLDCFQQVFPSSVDLESMNGDSGYNLMFGPDICGPGTKKVHVIFNYKGKNLLIKKDIRCKVTRWVGLVGGRL